MQLPHFSLPASDDRTYTDEDFSNGKFILYVYPKDMTPGCTIESKDFEKKKKEFEKLGFKIFGLSKDSVHSHVRFCTNESLSFLLISDPHAELMKDLGCWKEKSMFGKKYMGAERSTFVVIDGEIVQEWRKVKVPGHVEEVLRYCKEIS